MIHRTQYLVDRCKTSPMMAARADLIEREEVRLGGIALVVEPAITGEFLVQSPHHPVACDLGDDRGRGDGDRLRVAVDQRVAAAGQSRRGIAGAQSESPE